MRIQNNLMAMNTHRQLGVNNLNQTKSTEKLSSGYRINRAADDASGLSISEKMRAQIRGLNQASANAQDGISLVQAAEGALQETHSILQRMRELSVKAANDVNETADRDAIKKEMDQLTAEVDRIAFTTEFNKKTLLDGSLGGGSASVASGTAVQSASLASGTTAPTAPATLTFSNKTTSTGTAAVNAEVSLDFASAAVSSGSGNIQVMGKTVAVDDTMADTDIADAVEAAFNGDTTWSVSNDGAGKLTFTQITGTDFAQAAADANTDLTALDTNTPAILVDTAGVTEVAAGATTIDVSDGTNTATITANSDGTFTGKTASLGGVNYALASNIANGDSATVNFTAGSPLTLQVGANTGTSQTIQVSIQGLSAAGLGIDTLDVSDHTNSQAAIASVESAIQKVSDQRSALGAVQNRLEHTVSNLDTVSENLQSAESRIRDVDMAKEMMSFTKNNILSQAATAMLAQANQAPQTVLQLLR